MAELTVQAALPPPEIEENAGGVVVRFRPSRYVPPTSVKHDLTERQQIILQILGRGEKLAFRDIIGKLGKKVRRWLVKEDLAHLKRLELVESKGHGRGACWFLKGK